MKKPINAYHATLRRVPDDIILAVATRPIDIANHAGCVCAWIAREQIATVLQQDADSDAVRFGRRTAQSTPLDAWGGEYGEWIAINGAYGTLENADALEDAFVARVMEACGL